MIITGSQDELLQMVQNLLENGIRYAGRMAKFLSPSRRRKNFPLP